MVFQQEQVRVLKEYYVRRGDKPTEEECSVLGASIAPPLTSNQVYQWFARERVKAQGGRSDINNLSRPSVKNQNLNNIKFSPTPPTLKLDMKSSFEEAPLSPASHESDESMLDLKQRLFLLCPKNQVLSESALIPFAKIMNTHNKTPEDIEQILKLIENTKTSPQVLQRFVVSKAFVTLCNLKQIIFESNNPNLQNLYLDVFMLLPFVLKIFNEFKVPKYFKQVWEKEIKDQGVLQKLNELYKKWRSDATTTANINVKRAGLEISQGDEKKQKMDEKKIVKSGSNAKSSIFSQLQAPAKKENIPIAKAPFVKSNLFAQLKTSKLDGRPIVHRTSSELISGKNSGSMDETTIKESPIIPSYKKSASPPPVKKESISEKTGKPKKTVSFNFEKLDSIVYFLIDDRPEQISGIQAPLPNRSINSPVDDTDVAHIVWQTPLPLFLPNNIQKCSVNSPEAIFQEIRERTAISAVYLNPKLIPSSPAEPTAVEVPLNAPEPVRWKLNKTPVEEIAIDNKILSAIPFLSALLGQPQQLGLAPTWRPMMAPQQTIPTQQNSYPLSTYGVSAGAEPYNPYSSASQNYSHNYPQNNSSGRR